jgi:isoquinoline 1-oxidoreductase beta subunit
MTELLTAGGSSDADVRDIMGVAEAFAQRGPRVDRRSFIRLAALAGGGLALEFRLLAGSSVQAAELPVHKDFVPNGYVQIAEDGGILLYCKNPEIGQGLKTAFPLIIAEELDADWTRVRVEQAPIDAAVYGAQRAGGSRSIPTNWDILRQAGAAARFMLVSAAAQAWSVPATQCRTEASFVIHQPSGRRSSYGELATRAAAQPVPDPKTLTLKKRADWRLLGKRVLGVDTPKILSGKPLYGIDTVIPGMQYAVFEKCPAVGGRVVSANLEEIRKLPGVTQAFVVAGTGKPTEVMPGVAILAKSTWHALDARRRLKVVWDESSASKDSWSKSVADAQALAQRQGAESLHASGDVDKVFAAGKVVEAFYAYPFLVHAPLEPQNCTADYRDGQIELWAPSQTPDAGLKLVATVLGIAPEKVTVHLTRAGGGFGRRLMNDYMCEAALISKQAAAPVKLQWTREDDMQHDFCRSAGFHSFKAGLENGRLTAWQDHFITFSADGKTPSSGADMRMPEFPVPLLPNLRLTQTMLPLRTPTGPWRAPRSNAIAFAVQSFLHECALAAGRDHVEFLLEVLGAPRWLEPGNEMSLNTGRAAAVIRLAAEKAGWGRKLPAGRGLGIAFHFSHAGHFAEVAEVSVDASRKLKLHKVTVAADVGPIINMSSAENQVQGCVIDAFSVTLAQELSIENGRVEQTNFDRYPLLRIQHAPEVDVHFIQSDFTPTGIGEPALPPAAPAICNAIFAACGHRVRRLPLVRDGFTV